MKLLKYALIGALIVTAIQVILYGERGAYNGLFVRLGLVSPGPVVTLKDRVTGSMDRARADIQSGQDLADRQSETNTQRIRRKVQGDMNRGADRYNQQGANR
jgi:hypothetical protein